MNDEHSWKCPFKGPTLNWSYVKVCNACYNKLSLKLIVKYNTHFLTCLLILNTHESWYINK